MTEYTTFLNNIDECNIRLHDSLVSERPSAGDYCWEPTPWAGAVAVAGQLLRRNQNVHLTSEPIPDELVGDTVPEKTFVSIVNASHKRQALSPDILALKNHSLGAIDTCQLAESYFADLLLVLKNPDFRFRSSYDPSRDMGWRVVTHDNTSAILIKTDGIESALSLIPLSIDGVVYPAGSLLRVCIPELFGHDDEERISLEAISITKAAFLRLSTFACEPAERAIVMPHPAMHKIGHESGMAEIQSLADAAVAGSVRLDLTSVRA